MTIERKTKSATYGTTLGKLTISEVVRVHRESLSGNNEVVAEHRESVEFMADGDWLTDDMASQLERYLREGGQVPEWLADARPC